MVFSNNKVDILNAWIMVEHLSEGALPKNVMSFDNVVDSNYYGFLQEKLANRRFNGAKNGFVLYLDIFDFNGVVDTVREIIGASPAAESVISGKKFTLSLCFDKNLSLQADSIFFTIAGYIKLFNKIPEYAEFHDFETKIQEKITDDFVKYGEADNQNRAALFNKTFLDLLKYLETDVTKSGFEIMQNIESDASNLHSFFINDLEAAKTIETDNLEKYLTGLSERVNVDTNKESPNFDPGWLWGLLKPSVYPNGRFPTNTKYALSLMQQIAVNLSAASNREPLRSVNGPPGTGKTTLLKDVFADYVVKQALNITHMTPDKGKGRTISFPIAARESFWEEANIGVLPENIVDNSIIVASSNNSAVQNIVNELPLSKDIDESLLADLLKADYFTDIANGEANEKWDVAEDGKKYKTLVFQATTAESPKNWGLFSMEGGASGNMTKILNKLEVAVKYLKDEYEPKPSAYDNFNTLYKEVERIKQEKLAEYDQAFNGASNSAGANWLDLNLEYDKLQLTNPWFDEDFRVLQSRLFIAALVVRKQFLYENRFNLEKAVKIFGKQDKHLENKQVIEIAFGWINLAVPVISSTFASFGRMCKNLGPNSMGHLFVDEAGQAVPQAVVGAIYRCKNTMVVGDPSQIKPVTTLDENIIAMLGTHYGVTDKYLSDKASVQTLVDTAGRFGYYCKDESWIGLPLWVHRRCKHPMFDIANAISYDGMMVQGNPAQGKTGWFNISGKAQDKYVREQGDFLVSKLRHMIAKNPDIVDKSKKDVVYVITPFKNVARKLEERLDTIGFTRRENGKTTNVGTVHTFQGKEAPIVFFVLGVDEQNAGAAKWAVNEPNILNVATTRAKDEFYIVGDYSLYRSLGSEVVDRTREVINDYKDKYPDLIDDVVPPLDSADFEHASEVDVQNQENTVESFADEERSIHPEDASTIDANRTFGVVTYVGQAKSGGKYAYVKSDSGDDHSVPERMFLETHNADVVLVKGNRVSFISMPGGKNPFAKDVRLA